MPGSSASLTRNFSIVGAATMVSRLTGFGRDMLVAAAFGTGNIATAYVAAFLIPNLFRRMVGEGTFNAAFVPIFCRLEAAGGRAAALAFVARSLSAMLLIGGALVTLAIIAMPAVMSAVAGGFKDDPERFNLAVDYARIAFPFVALVLLTAVCAGALNALGRYALAAWAPVLFNLMMIATLVALLLRAVPAGTDPGGVLVATVTAGGLTVLVLVYGGLWRSFGPLPFATPTQAVRDPDVRRHLMLALPGLAIAGAGHLNVVVAAHMASHHPMAVAWLYYAERLFQLPLGFVAAAVGVVLLPSVAHHLQRREVAAVQGVESRAFEFGLLLMLPAAGALVLLAKPIVSILFERGAFTGHDTRATATMLKGLAMGLPAFVLIKVFLPAFLARENLRIPLIAAAAGVASNVAVSSAFTADGSPVLIAAGVSVSAWVNALILYAALWQNGHFRLDAPARQRLPLLLLATVLTLCVTALLHESVRPFLRVTEPLFTRLAALVLICGGAVAGHLLLMQLLKLADIERLAREALRSRGS